MARKHVATGKKPPGGPRAGAGRKSGTQNTLPYGVVQAVKTSGLRIPQGTDPGHAALADLALEKVRAVLAGEVFHINHAGVLKAATIAREEVCGPVKQRVEHSFEGLTDEQLQARYEALTAKPEGDK